GRFADIFFSIHIPGSAIWQLAIALMPNVIAFTAPMSALVGVVLGLSKMQGDREVIAMRSAGVGNSQFLIPVIVIGLFLSLITFIVNIYGVP
ncbi:LptF/LptG family permease, partial [Vibrio sp. Vb2424]|uniref:LptF/LptG family permease n=1 Tax=Vibrio sp. Vb2424 TaxID=2816074 RepID=UPI001A8E1274